MITKPRYHWYVHFIYNRKPCCLVLGEVVDEHLIQGLVNVRCNAAPHVLADIGLVDVESVQRLSSDTSST